MTAVRVKATVLEFNYLMRIVLKPKASEINADERDELMSSPRPNRQRNGTHFSIKGERFNNFKIASDEDSTEISGSKQGSYRNDSIR